ncbi:MAG: 1,4-alpha-glucan branching protein domain-containing protein [Candidatus Omnitrophota bacterium]
MMSEKGYLSIVLHGHLPFVRHPEHEDFLEENWLYEAITETYIPLIDIFESLVKDNVDFRITLGLTPPLLSMLTDSLLQDRYLRYLDRLVELASREAERTQWQPEYHQLALHYLSKINHVRYLFKEKYEKNIITAFKKLAVLGKVEIITSAATHGYMPLMDVCMESIRAQIRAGVVQYQRIFGWKPKGIWLPECGYTPQIDNILRENGLRYFFVDAHGVLHGIPRPKYGVFAPVYCRSGVAAFGRDMESSKQVWSAVEGYPGDYVYREFYRDIGFDLDFEYIKPYIHKDGIRINTGIKYYRITGRGIEHKEPYDPHVARDRAAEHAGNFMFNREKQVEYLYDLMKKKPIIVSPYDAELFGHWWYEGPQWLNFLFRKIHHDQNIIKTITPSEYLEKFPRNQVITPSVSSWGWKGYSEVWLEGSNDWIYRHLHKASWRMTELVHAYPNASNLLRRALNQALRELLLAQSSDWAFIMKTQTHVPYAVKRTKDHILQFTKLYHQIKHNAVNEDWLSTIEYTDNIFPNIDYRIHK